MTKPHKTKSGIFTSRVVIRPYIPWYFSLLVAVIIIALLFALAWGMYEAGSRSAKYHNETQNMELDPLFDSGTCIQKNREDLCTQISRLVRQQKTNSAIHQDLSKQVKFLGDENNHLKEELAFFQHLMSGNAKINKGISIYRFKLIKGQPTGIYRYTLSLVQGGRRPKDFQGTLKFSVKLKQNNQIKMVSLASKSTSKDFSVEFKFYHRMEESFQVPANATVESLQVQVFEKDVANAKLIQTIELSK